MNEQTISRTTPRTLGLSFAGREPSHIHLPRRRRSVPSNDQGTSSATHGTYANDVGHTEPRTSSEDD
jgi:hypothetical protein